MRAQMPYAQFSTESNDLEKQLTFGGKKAVCLGGKKKAFLPRTVVADIENKDCLKF